MKLELRLKRDDHLPAFGGFLRCECPDPEHNNEIYLNVAGIMSPVLLDEEGTELPQSREDRKRLLITTLMHEFGHALEAHFKIPMNEQAIERACADWERPYAEQPS